MFMCQINRYYYKSPPTILFVRTGWHSKVNKLASLKTTLPETLPTQSQTGVKCRATRVAKKYLLQDHCLRYEIQYKLSIRKMHIFKTVWPEAKLAATFAANFFWQMLLRWLIWLAFSFASLLMLIKSLERLYLLFLHHSCTHPPFLYPFISFYSLQLTKAILPSTLCHQLSERESVVALLRKSYLKTSVLKFEVSKLSRSKLQLML